jgi:hypothetical protein
MNVHTMGRVVLDLLYGEHYARANALNYSVMQAHAVASMLAPSAPVSLVEHYVATCARADRTAIRWGQVGAIIGGWTPGFMWALGYLVQSPGGWGIVAAQWTWIALWLGFGWPRFDAAISENRMTTVYGALGRLCDAVDDDTLAAAGVQRERKADECRN